MKVLFVTWDGPQVSYLEGLFLPIFAGLANHGIQFHVLQFTWGAPEVIQRRRSACEQAGISYQAVRVWRRPRAFGALLTALAGTWRVRRSMKRVAADLVMPRSTLPALATLLALRGNKAVPMVFDADGFAVDERVEFAGQSPSSLVYRFMRDVEAQAVRRATCVLTRTRKAVDMLIARAGPGVNASRFHVVSNGRDSALFDVVDEPCRRALRAGFGVEDDAALVVYAGSMGEQYLPARMVTFFSRLLMQRPDARLLVLTGSPEAFREVLTRSDVSPEAVRVITVSANEVPAYLSCADLGLCLREASYSMQGVSPIKLGEYLLCGVPVIASRNVVHVETMDEDVAWMLDEYSDDALDAAVEWFLSRISSDREKARSLARKAGLEGYALELSIAQYKEALMAAAPSGPR